MTIVVHQAGERGEPGSALVWFWCEGCRRHHAFTDASRMDPGSEPVWQWNQDREKPVFSPSLMHQWDEGPGREKRVCHSFVGSNGAQPGQIYFLGDCTHALAGQMRDLPEWRGFGEEGYT